MPQGSIDREFYVPRTPVGLAVLGNTGEALLIRSILESLNAVTMMHLIGTPNDFLAAVDQGDSAPPYLVISGHGDENGFVMGEFIEEIDISALKNGSLPAASLHGSVRLPGTVVFSTACESGRPEFANAFLSGGASAYIAAADLPDGADVPLIVHMFFHGLFRLGHDLEAAWRHTVEHVGAARDFTLFSKTPRGDGDHDRGT